MSDSTLAEGAGSKGPTGAFALSLADGALMLLGGALLYLWFSGVGYGMVGVYQGTMGGYGGAFSPMNGLLLVSLAAGVGVMVGALRLNLRPAEHAPWGTVILAFSLIGLVGMDAIFLGAALGVIGGLFAISWRPSRGGVLRDDNRDRGGMRIET